MPEFQNESDSSGNSTIIPTTNDLLALWVQYTQSDASEIQITNTTDVGEFKKIVNMTFAYHDEGDTFLPFDDSTSNVLNLLMLDLSEDRNTGYIVFTLARNDVNDIQTQQRLQQQTQRQSRKYSTHLR
jgi:hypothetical protein